MYLELVLVQRAQAPDVPAFLRLPLPVLQLLLGSPKCAAEATLQVLHPLRCEPGRESIRLGESRHIWHPPCPVLYSV